MGVGLNLTAACRCVIFDPSWNPAVDSQSVDRCYRIGQTAHVVVYRFITCGTVEEVIYRKQIFKQGIFNSIHSTHTQTQTDTPGQQQPLTLKGGYFTRQELREVFSLRDHRRSDTQRQLAQLHPPDQRRSYAALEAQLRFVESHRDEVFGLSDHDLLFNAAARDHSEDGEEKEDGARQRAQMQVAHLSLPFSLGVAVSRAVPPFTHCVPPSALMPASVQALSARTRLLASSAPREADGWREEERRREMEEEKSAHWISEEAEEEDEEEEQQRPAEATVGKSTRPARSEAAEEAQAEVAGEAHFFPVALLQPLDAEEAAEAEGPAASVADRTEDQAGGPQPTAAREADVACDGHTAGAEAASAPLVPLVPCPHHREASLVLSSWGLRCLTPCLDCLPAEQRRSHRASLVEARRLLTCGETKAECGTAKGEEKSTAVDGWQRWTPSSLLSLHVTSAVRVLQCLLAAVSICDHSAALQSSVLLLHARIRRQPERSSASASSNALRLAPAHLPTSPVW